MLGGGYLLEAVRGDCIEMAVDDGGDEPVVGALALGLQAQAFGEIARADAGRLEALNDCEDAQDLRLAASHRTGNLSHGQCQVTAAVERADEEGRDSALFLCPVLTLKGEVDLLEQLFLQCRMKRCRCIELALVFIGEVRGLLAATVEVVGERANTCMRRAALLVELPTPRRIVHLEHGVLQVFFFNGRAEFLCGELQDLDGLLQLHRHRQMLREIHAK